MINYDPTNPGHRRRAAFAIKSAWHRALVAANVTGQGGAPDTAPAIAATYAKAWADAGLDPNSPDAPRAPEGVAPLPPSEPLPVAPPPEYDGPSIAEIDAELAAQSRNVTSVERIRQLRQMRAHAVREGVKE